VIDFPSRVNVNMDEIMHKEALFFCHVFGVSCMLPCRSRRSASSRIFQHPQMRIRPVDEPERRRTNKES